MSAAQLIVELEALGVRLWADGELLRYDAPGGALTGDDRERLRAAKSEIIALLEQRAASGDSIPRADRRQPLPLSFAQQRLWFLDQFAAHVADLAHGVDHVDRHPDCATLIGNGSGDCLPNPPGGVG